jgi:S1-C subfamily serine protease
MRVPVIPPTAIWNLCEFSRVRSQKFYIGCANFTVLLLQVKFELQRGLSHMLRVPLLASILFLSACATPMTSPHDITPPTSASNLAPINFGLGQVSLDYLPGNPTAGEFLRSALQVTLSNTQVFNFGSPRSLDFAIVSLSVDQDHFGLNMTARATANYRVNISDGGELFSTSVFSAGLSKIGDHFVGAQRVEFATRRAVANNIAKFRDKFLEFIRGNRAKIELASRPKPPDPPSPPASERPPQSPPKSSASGSGFFVSKLGHIVTNAHVVDRCGHITVGDNAKNQTPAIMSSKDDKNDLALLKLSSLETASGETKSLIKNLGLKVIPLAADGLLRSEDAELGESVMVAGFPFGDIFSNTIKVTGGLVSAVRGIGDDTGQF